MKKVSIMVPVYNEEEVITLFHSKLKEVLDTQNYNFEILFINDGSKDSTLEIIKSLSEEDPRVSFVDFSRNFGKEIAMAAGFDYASGDAVINMDVDLQDPPDLIPRLLEEWENGYDDVYAKRISRKGESALKKSTSFLFYRILEKMSSVPIQKDTGDFRLLSRRAVDSLKKYGETQRYTKGFYSLIGFPKKAVEYERDARAAGETKWNYLQLINLAIEGITSFTVKPLKWANLVGILLAMISLLYMLFIFIRTIIYDNPVAGYPSLISIILFLGGVQLISLGIIGEYLGRIFNETKNRPLYFVAEYHKSDSEDL